jgi:hypothetical protein
MWTFKSCPRCQGDLFVDEYEGACFEKCLQCGYERQLERVAVLKKPKIVNEKTHRNS